MRNDAVGPGMIIVHGAGSGVEHDPYEKALSEGPLEGQVEGVNDVDARVRAIGQIVLSAIRIDPADVV